LDPVPAPKSYPTIMTYGINLNIQFVIFYFLVCSMLSLTG
jgi:hypothetical protein